MFETQEMFVNSVQINMQITETLPADFFTVVFTCDLPVISSFLKDGFILS